MEETGAEYVAKSQAENEREEHLVIELGSIESERALHGGERRSRARPLSAGQMESLAALCDTFVPSIDVSNHAVDDDSVLTFYRTSASTAGASLRVTIRLFIQHIDAGTAFNGFVLGQRVNNGENASPKASSDEIVALAASNVDRNFHFMRKIELE
ncbi:long-chain-alcohol oxidase [Sarracenia purpurea var. burkii]